MVFKERAETAAASRGTSHVTAKQRCKYTSSMGYKEKKKLQSLIKSSDEIKRRSELHSHEELDNYLRVQTRAKEKRGDAGPSKKLRRGHELGDGAVDNLLLLGFLSSCATDIVLWFCSAQHLKQQLAVYTSCFTLARSPLSKHSYSGGGPRPLRSFE